MSGGGRCQRRKKMMGRGGDGGCGTEEKPCPLSRPQSTSPPSPEAAAAATTSTAGVGCYEQALKALSERCPFDSEESAPKVPTLPSRVAAYLSRQLDGRRKYKKSSASHGEPAAPHSGRSPAAPNVWEEMEEYFRPVTQADIDCLIPKLSDSCFLIPVIENPLEVVKKDASFSECKEAEVEVNLDEEEEQVREVESAAKCSSSISELPSIEEGEEEEEAESSSMNWILGSKHRVMLTTQRPSKKRKLLGGDAGLDQLLRLPRCNECSPFCDICCLGESGSKSNQLITCNSCGVSVHKWCYGKHEPLEKPWLCSLCKNLELMVGAVPSKEGGDEGSRPCLLCPKGGGALKPVGGNVDSEREKFVHLFCSLWTPEVYVENTRAMEPVMNVGGVQETRTRLVCNLCKVKHGVCVRCSHGTCRTAFHPRCAREARHHMEIWGKFGCDNVELRAFCAKHSTVQDVGSAQLAKNIARSDCDGASAVEPLAVTAVTNKLPKLRLSRKNKDKNTTQAETTTPAPNEVANNAKILENDAVSLRPSPERGDLHSNKSMDVGVTESSNSLPNSSSLILLFKKLIARGKINFGDVASEIDISSDSLEAALKGEISSFPSELRSKIIKWLQDSIHMPASMRHLKSRSGSAISSGSLIARVACPKAADVSGHATGENLDNADDACLAKALPLRRRTKSNKKILKDTTIQLSGENAQESCNKEPVDEIGEGLDVRTEDMRGDTVASPLPTSSQGCSSKDQTVLETILEDISPGSNPSQVLPSDLRGTPSKLENDDLSKTHQPECLVENAFSSKCGNGQADDTNITSDDVIKKDGCSYQDFGVDTVASETPALKVGECSSSYVHPSIQKRLMFVQKDVLLEQKGGEAGSNGHRKNRMFYTETTDSCNHPTFPANRMDHMLGSAQMDQLSKAKSMGILDLSPEDELEGEILYLQNRLLDSAVEIKHRHEDLLSRVVQKLPEEQEAFKKKRWDSVLVNQFLREVREAKKRGRKERKHREAQAVLAAAAAAAATSSRNSMLRKDANAEVVATYQESPLKVSLSGRAAGHSALGPRLKDTPRSAIVKVPPDKQSGIFQMPEFSKENAPSCDICRRVETLLTRILVCSSCKVSVHLDCYRKLKDPIGSWKCELCEELSSQSPSPRHQTVDNFVAKCGLCGGGSGAFRKSTDGQWVHAFCAEWLLESTFRRGQQNLVDGMDAISKEKDLLTCCICYQKVGVCLKCSYGHCQIAFHPSCARSADLYMNAKAIGGKLHHKAYCAKHSVEQRQKADSQQYGAEELKGVKQIRVELEKVRLLCERIIKREKVKRDLALCSHDILASRRDYVAFSMLVRNPFTPGVSSESATTSIDNKSYSGTIQRSEDVTVDSTVSGKRTSRLLLDMDQKTDDSSTSQSLFKRKMADRTSLSGKQLPKRAASVSFRSSAEDGEKRSTTTSTRKHTENVHKEVVMTSHQASMQNQRLPKGFAYVPVGSFSKEGSVIHDSESHDPQGPGG